MHLIVWLAKNGSCHLVSCHVMLVLTGANTFLLIRLVVLYDRSITWDALC